MDNITIFNISIFSSDQPWLTLNVPYAIAEGLAAISAIIGNSLIIIAFGKERKLRGKTKYYIISLAIADLLIGLLGIPFAILGSVGLPKNIFLCLFTMSFLIGLSAVSIFCLVAISVDRYWATLYPISYYKSKRGRNAIGVIILSWLTGALIGFLPLLGWNKGGAVDSKCLFVEIMTDGYLVFLYFAIILVPAVLLAAIYTHIYRAVLKQLRRKIILTGFLNHQPTSKPPTGVLRKREIKRIQNLSIIVLFFMICWIPLNTINVIKAFWHECKVSSTLIDCCIVLSHLNSSFNPFLYAYNLKDFRTAILNLIFRRHGFPTNFKNSSKWYVIYSDNSNQPLKKIDQ